MIKQTIQRVFLAIAVSFFPAFAIAQSTNLSLHVEEAGTLHELLAENLATVENLTLSGELNEEDITTLRYMLEEKSLADVDIENVIIDNRLLRFDGLYQLRSVVLPADMDTIPEYAFAYCGSLESVTFPRNLKVIGQRAFSFCELLASVDFPETLTHIADEAFMYSYSLQSVFLPKSLGRIETYGIFTNSGITSAILEEGIIATGKNLFAGCMFLESISLPNSLKIIDDQAFFGTEALTSIVIPENVDSIGAYGFMSANNLLKIYSKNPIPPFMQGAFSGDPKIVGIVYVPEGSLEAYKSASEWEEFTYIQEEIVTGIEDQQLSEAYTIVGGEGEVFIEMAEKANIQIYTLAGVRAFASSLDSGEHNLPLRAGVYIVKINNESHKILVR